MKINWEKYVDRPMAVPLVVGGVYSSEDKDVFTLCVMFGEYYMLDHGNGTLFGPYTRIAVDKILQNYIYHPEAYLEMI